MRCFLIICTIIVSSLLLPSQAFANNKCQELYPDAANGHQGNCNFGYDIGANGGDADDCYVADQGVQDACLAGWQAGRNDNPQQPEPNQPQEPSNPTQPGAVPDLGSPKECGDVSTAYVGCNAQANPNSIEQTTVWALLTIILNILLALMGIIAVAGVIYGSILYTSAQGNMQQIQQAKSIIRNVLIGLVLYVLLYAILQYLIPGSPL